MSLAFNGTTSYLEWAGDIVGSRSSVVFFAWFKPRGVSLSGNTAIVSAGKYGAGTEASLLTIGGTEVRANSRDGSGSATAAASFTLAADTWTPVAGTFNFASGNSTGRSVRVAAATASDVSGSASGAAGAFDRLRVGMRAFSDTLPFEGDIAALAIYSALSDADYAALRGGADPSAVSTSTLIEYWPLHDQAATHTGTGGTVLTAHGTSQGADNPFGDPPPATGTRGDAIPATGTNGPSFLYPLVSLPADSAVLFRFVLGAIPAGLTFSASADGGFTASAADGVYTVPFELYRNDVDSGAYYLTLTFGTTGGVDPVLIGASVSTAGCAFVSFVPVVLGGQVAAVSAGVLLAFTVTALAGQAVVAAGGVLLPDDSIPDPGVMPPSRRPLINALALLRLANYLGDSMSRFAVNVEDKDVDEIDVITFAYVDPQGNPVLADGESITQAAISVDVRGGTDNTPEAILSGAPSISGVNVRQKVQGGVQGALYGLRCKATTSTGRVLTVAAKMNAVKL